MAGRTRINRLSEARPIGGRQGSALVMVGSFAPIHQGHFDAVHAAHRALTELGETVESLVLTPNSAEYVKRKLQAGQGEWTYERRLQEILRREPHPTTPTYVDDISGRIAALTEMNDHAPVTIERYLGYTSMQTYLVVGSDQMLSMQSHLDKKSSRAICVLRPGSLGQVQDHLAIPWIAESVDAGRFILTERENMEYDISSTAIRQSMVAG